MTDVAPIHWPTDEDDPVRDGELTGRQWLAEHASAHAETGICFPCWFGGHAECGIDPHCENTEKEMPDTMDRHGIDEPCPEGCPTRLAEIAWYLSEHGGVGVITEEDVRAALATPPESRDAVQRLIADTESDWI